LLIIIIILVLSAVYDRPVGQTRQEPSSNKQGNIPAQCLEQSDVKHGNDRQIVPVVGNKLGAQRSADPVMLA
jgi:hypothetical protein